MTRMKMRKSRDARDLDLAFVQGKLRRESHRRLWWRTWSAWLKLFSPIHEIFRVVLGSATGWQNNFFFHQQRKVRENIFSWFFLIFFPHLICCEKPKKMRSEENRGNEFFRNFHLQSPSSESTTRKISGKCLLLSGKKIENWNFYFRRRVKIFNFHYWFSRCGFNDFRYLFILFHFSHEKVFPCHFGKFQISFYKNCSSQIFTG